MSAKKDSSSQLRAMLDSLGKRPRLVLKHILEHGSVTTEQLRELYDYTDPRRAKQDLQEQGVAILSQRVSGKNGRKIACYSIDYSGEINVHKHGRLRFPKRFKDDLVALRGEMCSFCLLKLESRSLQIDHAIPYEIGGEPKEMLAQEFMLVCRSCNRAKSWSCENCFNFLSKKDSKICMSCYWAVPSGYTHIAGRQIRRLDLTFAGDEVKTHDALKQIADSYGTPLPDYVKRLLERAIQTR